LKCCCNWSWYRVDFEDISEVNGDCNGDNSVEELKFRGDSEFKGTSSEKADIAPYL